MNCKMMKIIGVFILILILNCSLHAQVGINTTIPHTSSALEIESTNKGLLIPRMTTTQKIAIASPATSLLVYDITLRQIQQNAGTPTNPNWVPLIQQDTRNSFFYMPSISIDASTEVTNKTINLYDEYKKQFTGANTTTFARSVGAPAQAPFFPLASNLYYYITYYDNQIIKVNSIDANGVLNYDILKESDFDSFMNVVFVVK